MKKYLFLDVDGVLNSRKDFDKSPNNMYVLGEDKLVLLRKIVDETLCQIILSSTWRYYDEYKQDLFREFSQLGINRWIGETPQINPSHRGQEIAAWLADKQNYIAVILDDDPDANLPPHLFVQTDFMNGLTEEHALKIIEAFNESV